ncbi:MAG: DUF3429 domain-containing protein [Xanthomonadales bacterium]|jgi:hypothetical protein|nr:DUF3429 domain-containing protein [Xanthomonadales bacterium]
MSTRTIPATAKLLGYAGVLPFGALALLHVFGSGPVEAHAERAFLLYGGIILSFLGGIRWGVATGKDRFRGIAPYLSVLPSLWAFFFLLWPDPRAALWGLLAGFVVMGLADRFQPAAGSADWMIVLRSRLTSAVIACFGVLIASAYLV